MSERIQPHNARPAAVWSAGGNQYDEISHGIADAIEHCVLRLNPQLDERILDLSTGTGWTSRLVARRGAAVAWFEKATSFYRDPDGDAAWQTFATGYGPTRVLANSLDPDRLAALRADFVAFHDRFATALGSCVPREYWLAIGTRV